MGRSELCELVRRGLPWANQRLVLSLCGSKCSRSHYWTSGKTSCTNWSKTCKSNYLTSKATTPKTAIAFRTPCRNRVLLALKGMMGSPLLLCSVKPAHHSHAGTMCWPSPALHSSPPWCARMYVGVSGAVLHKVTKAWCCSNTCDIELTSDLSWRWSSDLVIYNNVATGRLFPISRYCFVLFCSLNLVFPRRAMTVTSMAVRHSFSSPVTSVHYCWLCTQLDCNDSPTFLTTCFIFFQHKNS